MAGGPRKIDEYNKSLTPEQRKANARRAAKSKRPKLTRDANIRSIARVINDAPANAALQAALRQLGVNDTMSNAAGIALAVYQAALNGDMRAVEKWERYVGQSDKDGAADGEKVTVVIDV